jgi:HD-GYP domain-containing protein (c-di-GMP phosphodiesterase class II)
MGVSSLNLPALKRGGLDADALDMASTAPAAIPIPGAELDPAVDLLIEETRAREAAQAPERRELAASAALGIAFLVAAAATAVFLPTARGTSIPLFVAFAVAYCASSLVVFEVGPVFALPTTLILIPMLFVLPVRLVPVCVAAGLLLRDVPSMLASGGRLNRAFIRMVASWHALGPALVLGLAGERSPSLRDVPWYVLALGAQFALDFAAIAARERLALGMEPKELLRFSSWAWLVDVTLAPVGLVVAVAAETQPYLALLVLPLIGLLAFFARERKTRIDHALELSHAYRGTALLLGDVVEADDAYTGSHSRDVVQLVLDVCDELGLSARERRDAEFVALLHDVGKIRIPAEIINKPGPLTAEERAIINTHTIEGERLLSQVGGLLGQIGRVVRSCHERWDGGGYPDGLAGDAIPRIARIVCACDAYSAITTTRPYRVARSSAEALEELRHHSGTQFDPAVVDALGRVLARPA